MFESAEIERALFYELSINYYTKNNNLLAPPKGLIPEAYLETENLFPSNTSRACPEVVYSSEEF